MIFFTKNLEPPIFIVDGANFFYDGRIFRKETLHELMFLQYYKETLHIDDEDASFFVRGKIKRPLSSGRDDVSRNRCFLELVKINPSTMIPR